MTTMQTPDTTTRYPEAAILADEHVPAIHIWRDFDATPAQLFRAHTEPGICSPSGSARRTSAPTSPTGTPATAAAGATPCAGPTDARSSRRRSAGASTPCGEDRIVQTFTWEGMPDGVALETMTFEDLGDGRTRLHAFSLCDSFEDRDGWLRSGMEVGVNDGYAAHRPDAGGGLALMSLPESPAARHEAVAGEFSRLVEQTSDWAAPAPVDGWTARDVVDHLVTWFPGFLSAGGVELPAGPSDRGRPGGRLAATTPTRVQALLDERGDEAVHPPLHRHPAGSPTTVDRFYTSDVFMHSWDLARATGQEAAPRRGLRRPAARGHAPDRGDAARLGAVRPRRARGRRRTRRRPADGLRRPRPRVDAPGLSTPAAPRRVACMRVGP